MATDIVQKAKEKAAKLVKRAEDEVEIMSLLPGDIPSAPTIANISDKAEVRAWLSFHGPSYDPDGTWDPVAILESLQRAGWWAADTTLVGRERYRVSPEPFAWDDVPEVRNRNKIREQEPMFPLWVNPCQHTKPDACLFMRHPSGTLFRVSVECRSLPVYLHARRIETRCDWSFAPGSGRIAMPDHWRDRAMKQSRAYVGSPKGIDGVIYFEEWEEGETPSEFLRWLSKGGA